MDAWEKGEERRIRRLQEEEWARLKAKAKKEQKERVDKMMDRLETSIRNLQKQRRLITWQPQRARK